MTDRRNLRIVRDGTHEDTSDKALDKASELIADQAKVGMQLSTSLAKTRVYAFAALALAIFVAIWPRTGNNENSGRSSPASVQPAMQPAMQPVTLSHWLSTSSGVRHNSSCRWYGKSDGRKCREDEGKPCRKCGG
jgi:hypothetical protein